MAWLLDASGDTLRAFLTDHVQQGATVITDGWARYQQWHVDGKWSGWHPVVDGGKLGSGPTVLSSGPNDRDVYVRGSTGSLQEKSWH
jgi:hypothetical protein